MRITICSLNHQSKFLACLCLFQRECYNKVHAIQYINYVRLVNNRYLVPHQKNRIFKGRSVFMRHLKDKVGQKMCLNDQEFLRTCRMSRKAFQKVVDEIKDHKHFINPKKTAEQNEEKGQKHLLHFLNFAGTFGDGASSNKSLTHCELILYLRRNSHHKSTRMRTSVF